MATWEDQTSPLSKFESSPAESFISAPGEMYPSLFASSPTPSTMDPLEMMTPPPLAEEMNSDPDAALVSALAATVPSSTPSTTPTASKSGESEKKPTKKRKSWGQVLPEPKTNLPPRKRAKTEDEKEQRRVERVLRNRRAAQSSRERKRQEVDALEKRNQELEARLLSMEKYSIRLLDELRVYRQTSGVVTRTSSPFDTLQTDSVTLSKELFSSQDGHQPLLEPNPHLNGLDLEEPSNPTVNPSSLSPKPAPNTETGTDTAPEAAIAFKAASADASSTDLTQRPAAMLCDPQCQQSGDLHRTLAASQSNLALRMLIVIVSLASICQRPLTQIALSLKVGFSLPETQSILKTIIWMVTRPASTRPTRSTTSCSSSTKTETKLPMSRLATAHRSPRNPTPATRLPTLRIRSLQKLLTSSPNLARPLKDATMVALRLAVSERCGDGVSRRDAPGRLMTRDDEPSPSTWLEGFQLPSWEVLLTLLWALECESRKARSKESTSGPITDICPSTTTTCTDKAYCSFKVVTGKRRREGVNMFEELGEEKRQRLD